MRSFVLFGAAVITAFSMNASADSTYSLRTSSIFMACTIASNQTSCESSMSPVIQDLTVTLTNCTTDNAGATSCYGNWNDAKTDPTTGLNYAVEVNISQTTASGSAPMTSVSYSVVAGNQQVPTQGMIIPSTTGLQDEGFVLGTVVPSASDATKGSMVIFGVGPQTNGLAAKIKNLKPKF